MAGTMLEVLATMINTLVACGPFESDQALRQVFDDPRLRQWADHLPHADVATTRARLLINDLLGKNNARGENALVLFVQVLRERSNLDPACARRLELLEQQASVLAAGLAAAKAKGAAPSAPPRPVPAVAGVSNSAHDPVSRPASRNRGVIVAVVAFVVVAIIAFLAFANGGSKPQPTPTRSPTKTPRPATATAAPTYTPEIAKTVNPDAAQEVENYINYAALLSASGDYEGAVAACNQAIALDDTVPEAYFNRGISYARLKRYKDALSDLSRAIELRPDYAAAYYNRGNVYDDLGDKDKALADYSQTLELDPQYLKAYNNRGYIYVDRGEYEKALAEFSQAIQLDPKFPDPYYNRAAVYLMQNEPAKACDDFKAFYDLTTNPQWKEAALGQMEKIPDCSMP
ncbi:MAG: tetratricopeptide repeat protein [Anaerolineae bacterium]|nr:tetratricopeptide repeat protein [Anaerolineae bacterium]